MIGVDLMKKNYQTKDVKLKFLKDDDMLLMIERGLRGGVYHSVHRHAKTNNT